MVKGLVIPADPEQPLEVRDFNDLDDYQAAVGGWIEAVDVPPIGVSIFVNEEGLIRQMPLNSRATFVWWYELPRVRQRSMLVGDAVMVGMPDAAGHSTNIPPWTLAVLTVKEPYAVLMKVKGSKLWVRHPVTYEDRFEAMVWAMVLSERITGATDVRALPEREVRALLQQDALREDDLHRGER